MNKRQRAQAARAWNKRLNAIERKYVVRVYNALRTQIAAVSRDIENYGREYAERRLSSLTFDTQMTETIQQLHKAVGLQLAKLTYNALERAPVTQKAASDFISSWLESIIEYFRLHLLESARQISSTTRDWILRKMEEGYSNGYSVPEIVQLINNREYMGYRAEMIVRTEGTRAANYGVQIGANAYDYEVDKTWISVPDNRRRHSHAMVDGQVRDINERYSNGLMFPGDPEGSAKEVINCRCTQGIVPRRDAKGKLIPKTRISVIQPGEIPRRQTITI